MPDTPRSSTTLSILKPASPPGSSGGQGSGLRWTRGRRARFETSVIPVVSLFGKVVTVDIGGRRLKPTRTNTLVARSLGVR